MANAFHFETLVWNWPIAIYLLLVGISSGLVLLSILLKQFVPEEYNGKNFLIRSTAVLAPLTVIVGLMILILHLTRPLTFWYLMVFYNPHSIMSLGVMLFQVYFVFILLWIVRLYRAEIVGIAETRLNRPAVTRLVQSVSLGIERRAGLIETILLVLAVLLGCYTGFLLSALKSYPMLNNPVLPVLFLVSGITSGIAVAMLAGSLSKNLSANGGTLHFIHKMENPVVYAEVFLLFAFFVGLFLGGGQKTVAAETALSGFWGSVFWIGIVGIGILVPLVAGYARKSHAPGKLNMACLAAFSLVGVFLLRMFVLYAGQMTVA